MQEHKIGNIISICKFITSLHKLENVKWLSTVTCIEGCRDINNTFFKISHRLFELKLQMLTLINLRNDLVSSKTGRGYDWRGQPIHMNWSII